MCTLHTLVIFSWSKNFIKSRVHRGGFIFKFVRHLSCNDCLWFLRVSFLSCFLLLRGINFLFQSSKIEKLGKLSHTSITKIRFLDSTTPFFWKQKKNRLLLLLTFARLQQLQRSQSFWQLTMIVYNFARVFFFCLPRSEQQETEEKKSLFWQNFLTSFMRHFVVADTFR